MASDEARRVLDELLAARADPSSETDLGLDIDGDRRAWEVSVADLNRPLDDVHDELTLGGVGCERVFAGTAPADTAADPVIVHLHGGGFALGSSVTHRTLARRLAIAGGCDVIVPNYRLAPEHPFPAGLDDCEAVVDALVAGGTRADQVVIGGDSSGAALALGVLERRRRSGKAMPAGCYLLSASIDPSVSGDSIVTHAERDPLCSGPDLERHARLYLGTTPATGPDVAPLRGSFEGYPSLLIHVGSEEVHLSDSTRLADTAMAAGVDVDLRVWDGMWHVFHSWTDVPEADQAIADIGRFVQRVTTDSRFRLRTRRLTLRRWTEADREAFHALNSDPEVMATIGPVMDRTTSDAFLDFIEAHFDQHGYGLFCVDLDGECIGFTGLLRPGWRDGIEIGWRIRSDHWGNSYAPEAASAVLDLAFGQLELDELISFTARTNTKSRRVMDKIGLLHDPDADFEHPNVPANSPLRPHVLYRLSAAQFEAAAGDD